MAIHSNILTWRIYLDTGVWQATVYEVAKSQTWLDLPNPETEPRSPTLQADTLPSEPPVLSDSTVHGIL